MLYHRRCYSTRVECKWVKCCNHHEHYSNSAEVDLCTYTFINVYSHTGAVKHTLTNLYTNGRIEMYGVWCPREPPLLALLSTIKYLRNRQKCDMNDDTQI